MSTRVFSLTKDRQPRYRATPVKFLLNHINRGMGRAMTLIGAEQRARTTALLALAALAGCGGAPITPLAPLAGGGAAPITRGAEPGIRPSPVTFSRHTVAHTDAGPAFAAAADLD